MVDERETVIRISPQRAEIVVEQWDDAGVTARKSLTPETFVFGDARICIGKNALPSYKDATRIFTLAGFILRLPNNDDMFSEKNNKSK